MFLLGADPEVFVGDKQSIRSIIGKIGGTKDHPLPLPIGDGFAIQEDNVAVEYNIPASESKQLFVENITSAMEFIGGVLKDRYGLHFVKDSAVSFPDTELSDPRAHVFGCDPDFNAWSKTMNHKPNAEDKNLRTCGGHVHIGVVGTKYEVCRPEEIIKACDLFLGVPSVFMDDGVKRKEMYGKHGAFRKKSYGVEYRTLSNFWIFSKETIEWVHEQVERALDAVLNGMSFDEDAENIQKAIDNNDRPLAQMLVDKYGLTVL